MSTILKITRLPGGNCIRDDAPELKVISGSVDKMIRMVGGKWSIGIIKYLYTCREPVRFNQLLKKFHPISSKTLSSKLKVLETYEIIGKEVVSGRPPSVQYAITDKGAELAEICSAMTKWHRKWNFIALSDKDVPLTMPCEEMANLVSKATMDKAALAAEHGTISDYYSIIEDAPMAVGLILEGQIIYTNQKYLDIFGFSNFTEVRSRPLRERIAPEFRGITAKRMIDRENGVTVSPYFLTVGVRKDGSRFDLLALTMMIKLADGMAHAAYFIDLSDPELHQVLAAQSPKCSKSRPKKKLDGGSE